VRDATHARVPQVVVDGVANGVAKRLEAGRIRLGRAKPLRSHASPC
jgi:hypothetical protein